MSNTKVIEIIKPFTNGLGRVIPVRENRIDNITRYPNEIAEKLVLLGVAVDLNRPGTCLFSIRRELAKELGLPLIEFIEK